MRLVDDSKRGHQVEAGALPLLGPFGYHGAMVFFWVAGEDPDDSTYEASSRQR